MEVIKKLKKRMKRAKNGRTRKSTKCQKENKTLKEYVNSNADKHKELITSFLEISSKMAKEPVKLFSIVNSVPLFGLVLQTLLFNIPITTLKPQVQTLHDLYLLVTLLSKSTLKIIFPTSTSHTHYIREGQIRFIRLYSQNMELFVSRCLSFMIEKTQYIINDMSANSSEFKNVTKIITQWVDSCFSLCIKASMIVMKKWGTEVMYQMSTKKKKRGNIKRKSKVSKIYEKCYDIQKRKVESLYIKVHMNILKFDNEESEIFDEYVMDFFKKLIFDSDVKNVKIRAYSLKIFVEIYKYIDISMVSNLLLKDILFTDPKVDIRIMTLNIINEILHVDFITEHFNHDEDDENENLIKKYIKAVLKCLYYDPTASVRLCAVKMILNNDVFKSYMKQEDFNEFLMKKSRDKDHRIRFIIFEYINNTNIFDDKVKVLFEISKRGIFDVNEKVLKIAKKLFENILISNGPKMVFDELNEVNLFPVTDVLEKNISLIMDSLSNDEKNEDLNENSDGEIIHDDVDDDMEREMNLNHLDVLNDDDLDDDDDDVMSELMDSEDEAEMVNHNM